MKKLTTFVTLSLLCSHLFATEPDPIQVILKTSDPTSEQYVKDISLDEKTCTPFNLEDEGGALRNVPFSHQFYANCYAAGATNMLNAWIKNKILPEQGSADRYMISPHHMAILYALKRKGINFPTGWSSDWNKKKVGELTQKEFFQLNKQSKAMSKQDKASFEEVLINRMYYFSEYGGGSALAAIDNALKFKVCPIIRVEKALGSHTNGQNFFRESRLVYEKFLATYDATDTSEKALKAAVKKLNAVMRRFKLPEDAYITEDEARNALMPENDFEKTDPLKYISDVFLSLCSKSSTHPPVLLKDVFSGKNAQNFPRTKTFNSSSPIFNDSVIEAHFKKVLSGKPGQLPLAISFAGHAIWEGTSHLAWKWDPLISLWTNDGKFGGHQGAVAGRRWNKKLQRCEYLVRNSFFSGTTAPGWTVDPVTKYGLWIKDEYLFRSINWFYYLVDQKNRP